MVEIKLKKGQLWKDAEGRTWKLLRPARRLEPCWVVIEWSSDSDDEWQLPSSEILLMSFVSDKA